MFAFPPQVRIYLASQPIDMRSGHDGLFAIVKSWDLDPFSGDLFSFVGKRGDRAKVLVWYRDGFLLLYERMETGRFRIPKVQLGTRTAVLDGTGLAMLLDGIDLTYVRRRSASPLRPRPRADVLCDPCLLCPSILRSRASRPFP